MESALSIDEQAKYLEISPGLLEYVPDILKDLDQLGPAPKEVYQLVKKLSLPSNPQILDLGSGKGAISNYLAHTLELIRNKLKHSSRNRTLQTETMKNLLLTLD
jgi:hypothetical protein